MEGIYQSIVRREAVESIEAQRRDMIAAAYSNPNWDGKDNAEKRQEYLKDLNRHFNQTIARIYEPKKSKEPEIDWENPFFAAHKRAIAKTQERLQMQIEGKTAGEILEAEEERETHRNGREREREFDQLEED